SRAWKKRPGSDERGLVPLAPASINVPSVLFGKAPTVVMTVSIEFRIEIDSSEKEQIFINAARAAAKRVFATAVLLGPAQQPQGSFEYGEFFDVSKEILRLDEAHRPGQAHVSIDELAASVRSVPMSEEECVAELEGWEAEA